MITIDSDELLELLPIADCVAAIDKVMREVSVGRANLPLRSLMAIGEGRRMGVMPGALAEPAVHGMKLLSLYAQHAPDRSSHQGVMVLFDSVSGAPLAAIEAGTLTALRTAAASAVATRVLARPKSRTLALIGCGEQASWHLKTFAATFKLAEVRIWGRTDAHAERFAREHEAVMPLKLASSIEQAIDGADIICTVTASATPILRGEWLKAGQHVNAVGASTADSAELDDEAVRRARFFVDYRLSAEHQAGELLAAIRNGVVRADHVQGEIGEVLSGSRPGRTAADDITLYKSLGIAAQDLAAGYAAYRRKTGAAQASSKA
jgi:ornithine cyclodeaminase